MAYKHIIKVSNVCQLLDKSKYPATTTNKGITITNNGDGSVTLNGTAISDGELYSLQYINLINGHKYYICDNQGGSFANIVFTLDALGSAGNREGNICTCNITSGPLRRNAYFYVVAGTVISNKVYKPQIFDLTEMYGAGHEPATVEQFRVNYPNDYYPYSPLTNLQSNKRMIKVSDVCQLLDKSKYNLPHTESGLTFTAGNDGSIIVNGTCTSTVWANISSFELNPEHTFLLIGCPGTNVNDVALYTVDPVENDSKQWEEGKGSLVTGNWYKHKNNELWIRILTGYVCNNLTFKPQLYDLTEMFGSGHEPATVAEFRQRFPNELYPYSPQCWLTSYKSAVVCKTKNLFDVNNAVPYTFTNDNPPSNRISLKDGIYTTTYNNYNVGSGLRIKDGLVLSPGTYTLSLNVITVGKTTPITGLTYGFRLYKSDGTKPVITTYTEMFSSRSSHAFTIPDDCTDIRLYLAPHCNSGQEYVYISLKDIQLEQGSTATTYVPYYHL